MKSVFAYNSYRQYLSDFYAAKKQSNPSYSYKFFSNKAKLNSPNYLKLVMDGKRNITHKTVYKFSKGLGLNERESIYFENLVFFNQVKDENEGSFYRKNMEYAKADGTRPLLSKDQYEILTNWYSSAVHQLSLVSDFKPSPRWIASRFDHKIMPQQAKEAIELLHRLGMIKINSKTGKISITNASLQTPDVDTSKPIAEFHKSILELAKNSIEEQKIEERCLSSLTVAINKKDLPLAFKKIHKFRNEMDSYFMKGKTYDSVYQMAIQLFRLDTDV